ncbi:MAG: hypothetical protein IKQ92_02825 [Clostridia bacterium]|nr:hypothetical protein [Clostridia bacterium]
MNVKKTLSLLLALTLVLPLLFSCGESKQNKENKPAAKSSAPAETVPGETPSAEEGGEQPAEEETKLYFDDLPEKMDYDGYKLRFLTFRETKSIELDEETDNIGDVVNEAYWKRNKALEDRCNAGLTIGEQTSSFTTAATQAVQSGTDDYDVFCGHCMFTVGLAAEGKMLKLNDSDAWDVIDIEKPYWSQMLIKNINYKDNVYWVSGDMTHTFISDIYGMFVNASLWDVYHPDESVYDLVWEGEWTLDKMDELAEGLYRDVNANGKRDEKDRYGTIMQYGHHLNGMLVAGGVQYTGIDDDGNYSIVLNNEHTVDVYTKLWNMFRNSDYGECFDNDKYYDISMQMFSEDRVLFCPHTLDLVEEGMIRDMESDYRIIPLPKYDTEQENYIVNQYDGVAIYGLPTSVPKKKVEMIATILEATCSMTHKIVIPVYYDVALKNKYSRDPETAQMIDLIHSCITADFCFNWCIGDVNGVLYKCLTSTSPQVASVLSRNQRAWDKNLEKVLKKLDG